MVGLERSIVIRIRKDCYISVLYIGDNIASGFDGHGGEVEGTYLSPVPLQTRDMRRLALRILPDR